MICGAEVSNRKKNFDGNAFQIHSDIDKSKVSANSNKHNSTQIQTCLKNFSRTPKQTSAQAYSPSRLGKRGVVVPKSSLAIGLLLMSLWCNREIA